MKCLNCHSATDMEFEEIEMEEKLFPSNGRPIRIIRHVPGRLYACIECGTEWKWVKGEKLKCRSGDYGTKVLAREILRRETK